MDNPTSVSVERVSSDTYTYAFDKSVDDADLSFLMGHSNIASYDVSGKKLTIVSKGSPDWTRLNDSFISPGLKRAFGNLKVDTRALASSR